MLPILLFTPPPNTIFKRYSKPIFCWHAHQWQLCPQQVYLLTNATTRWHQVQQTQFQSHQRWNDWIWNGFQTLLHRLDSIFLNKIDVSPPASTLMNPSPIQNVFLPSSATYKLFNLYSKQSMTTTNSSKQKELNHKMLLGRFSSKKTWRQPTIFNLFLRLIFVVRIVQSSRNVLNNYRIIQMTSSNGIKCKRKH